VALGFGHRGGAATASRRSTTSARNSAEETASAFRFTFRIPWRLAGIELQAVAIHEVCEVLLPLALCNRVKVSHDLPDHRVIL
jgi:hypothetical protein